MENDTIEFRILSPDDTRSEIVTLVTSKSFENINMYAGRRYYRYNHGNARVITIHPQRVRAVKDSRDQYTQQISLALRRRIKIRELIKNSKRSSIYMRVGKAKYLVCFRKVGIRYSCNGMNANFDILITALAKVIYRSCFETDEEKLDDYFMRCVELPDNIQYVLENRCPYHFYEASHKQEVRVNVKQIGKEKFALEISNGTWGEMTLRDLNTFVNSYLKGHKKGSWKRLNPDQLWERLLGSKPNDSQNKLMIEFLKQNRTQDIVDRRAMELFESLERKYSGIKRVKWKREGHSRGRKMPAGIEVDALLVRGKIADWLLVDNAMKHEFQEVSTYVLIEGSKDQYYSTLITSQPQQKLQYGQDQFVLIICKVEHLKVTSLLLEPWLV
mgnify:CR=1 FL=1